MITSPETSFSSKPIGVVPGRIAYSPARMRVASPVSRAYHASRRGWRSMPLASSSSPSLINEEPGGTSSTTGSSPIAIGEFKVRHTAHITAHAAIKRPHAPSAAMPSHLRIFAADHVHERSRRRPDGKRLPAERINRPDAGHRARHEQLVAAEQILESQVRLDRLESRRPGMREHGAAHHTPHAAEVQTRRQQTPALHRENIARDAAHHETARAAD